MTSVVSYSLDCLIWRQTALDGLGVDVSLDERHSLERFGTRPACLRRDLLHSLDSVGVLFAVSVGDGG